MEDHFDREARKGLPEITEYTAGHFKTEPVPEVGRASGFPEVAEMDDGVVRGRSRSVSPTCGNDADSRAQVKKEVSEEEDEPGAVPEEEKTGSSTPSKKQSMPIQCHICGKSLSSQGALYKHLLVLHNKLRLYMCEICGKSFGQHGDLKRHYYTHTGEKLFKCDQCGKLLSKASSLKLHMRTHTGERPYQCDVCCKTFAILSDLKRHVRIHSGEKLYSCIFCKRSFGRKEHLAAHYLTHSKEKPTSQGFGCEFCCQTFKGKVELRKHYMKHISKLSDEANTDAVQIPEAERTDVRPDVLWTEPEGSSSNVHEPGHVTEVQQSIGSTLRRLLTDSNDAVSHSTNHLEQVITVKNLQSHANFPVQMLGSSYLDSEKSSKQNTTEVAFDHGDNVDNVNQVNQVNKTSFSPDWKYHFQGSSGVAVDNTVFAGSAAISKSDIPDCLESPVLDPVSISRGKGSLNPHGQRETSVPQHFSSNYLPPLPKEISTLQSAGVSISHLEPSLYSHLGGVPSTQSDINIGAATSGSLVSVRREAVEERLAPCADDQRVAMDTGDAISNPCDRDSDNDTVNYCCSDKNDDSSSDGASRLRKLRAERSEKAEVTKRKSRSRKGKPKKYVTGFDKIKHKMKKSSVEVLYKSKSAEGFSSNDGELWDDEDSLLQCDDGENLPEIPGEPKYSHSTKSEDGGRIQTPVPKSQRKKRELFFVQCEVCGLAFTSGAKFRLHERTHTGDKPHRCHLCEKAYASKGDLKLHIEIHSGERRHVCEICGNSYLWAKSLKVHRQTHAEERPHKCATCHKSFYLKADLARHCRSHLGIKPHVCDVCQRSFTRKEHLIQHSYTHMEVKPNACEKCHKTFSQKVSLQKHTVHCQASRVSRMIADELKMPCLAPGFQTIDANALGTGLMMSSLCQ